MIWARQAIRKYASVGDTLSKCYANTLSSSVAEFLVKPNSDPTLENNSRGWGQKKSVL